MDSNGQQPPQQQPTTVVQVSLNGGVFPDENGTWRAVCWFTGIRTEKEAHNISGWLNGLLQAHMRRDPPPDQPTPPQ
jgi:hypothetical protein